MKHAASVVRFEHLGFSLVVHGGAGTWKGTRRRKGVPVIRKAASAGADIQRDGGTALDAVEACVVTIEEDPTFNAGYGSALNLLGTRKVGYAKRMRRYGVAWNPS